MKKTISLLEKIMLTTIFPKQGSRKELLVREDIINKVKLTQKDFSDFNIQETEKGGLTWDEKGVVSKFDIEFTDLEIDEIKASLKVLDEEKKLTREHNSLWEMFDVTIP